MFATKASLLSLLFALPFISSSLALPLESSSSENSISTRAASCSSLAKRVNWITLSAEQKKSYVDAVRCLQSKPSVSGISASKNLYDDFPAIHIQQNHHIHAVAAFLPWHRRYVQARERALKQCGYDGPTPYWDWTKAADQGDPSKDPIFSNTDGFGGNGGGMC